MSWAEQGEPLRQSAAAFGLGLADPHFGVVAVVDVVKPTLPQSWPQIIKVLGGSWAVIRGVISPLLSIIIIVTLLLTPL